MSSIFEKLIGRSRVVRFAFTISVSTSEKSRKKEIKNTIAPNAKEHIREKNVYWEKIKNFKFKLREIYIRAKFQLICDAKFLSRVCLSFIVIPFHLSHLRSPPSPRRLRFRSTPRKVCHWEIRPPRQYPCLSPGICMRGHARRLQIFRLRSCNMYCCSCVFSSFKLRKENCWLLNTAKMSLVPIVSHTK